MQNWFISDEKREVMKFKDFRFILSSSFSIHQSSLLINRVKIQKGRWRIPIKGGQL
jgi:hypothetical protein